jgi:hypothetical protein
LNFIEVDPESNEYKIWHQRFVGTPGTILPMIQANIKGTLNKFFDDSVRNTCQKSDPLFATERLAFIPRTSGWLIDPISGRY